MAHLAWAVLCQRVLIDKDTNAVSYIDSVEELRGTQFPIMLPQIILGMVWRLDSLEDEMNMRIRFLDPNRKEIAKSTPKIATIALRHRVNIAMAGPMVEMPGDHWFVVDQKKGKRYQRVAEIPLEVKLIKPADATLRQ